MIDNEKYQIGDNESEEDYEIRIGGYHDIDHLSWTDIANIINKNTDRNYSESHYRKGYKLYLKGKEDFVNEEIEELENSCNEEKTLREKYADASQKIPYYRELRKDSRFERFYKLVGQEIKKLPIPKYIKLKNDFEEYDKEYFLTMADLHIGACFDSVNNKYSLKIVEERFNILFLQIINFIQKNNVKKINILSLGDIIQGMLRISDLKLNEIPVVESFVFACRILSNFLNELSQYCYIDFIQVCYSNHDQIRYLGTKASELASEDMGKILFAYLTDVLSENTRIRILGDTNKDYVNFKIFDFDAIALHGHQVNNLQTIAKDLSNNHRKFFDYVFLAHSHSAKELISAEGKNHDIEILVAPSFVGSCPYADKLMVGSKAACKIFEFDKKYGHTASYKFILN